MDFQRFVIMDLHFNIQVNLLWRQKHLFWVCFRDEMTDCPCWIMWEWAEGVGGSAVNPWSYLQISYWYGNLYSQLPSLPVFTLWSVVADKAVIIFNSNTKFQTREVKGEENEWEKILWRIGGLGFSVFSTLIISFFSSLPPTSPRTPCWWYSTELPLFNQQSDAVALTRLILHISDCLEPTSIKQCLCT